MRLRWSTTDITVPNGQLQDTETHVSNAVIRENRGLAPITFSAWPINIIKKVSIKTMDATEHTNIVNLLIASAGDEIVLTDQDGQDWTAIITTPIPEIITVRDGCSYDLEFEFMGSKL